MRSIFRAIFPLVITLSVVVHAPGALAADTQPPTATIAVPNSSNPIVKGTQAVLDTDARDNVAGQLSVTHYVNGARVGTATLTTFGYVTWWNSTGVPDGRYTVTSLVIDSAGNKTWSEPVSIIVDNFRPAPKIAAPVCGGVYTGKVTVSAAANETVNVTMYLDGRLWGPATPSIFGYVRSLDTATAMTGNRALVAKAVDSAGNVAYSPTCYIRLARKTYMNPVFTSDAPDPSVMRAADGLFYAYTTEAGGMPFQVLRSRDLTSWTRLGAAFSGSGPAWVKDSRWAPEVRRTGSWYTMLYPGARI